MQKAVILAAGRGTRMKALTADRPKPMIEVAGKPLLEHILDRMVEAGFNQFLIITGYRAAMIENYFADYRLPITFQRQEVANGTATAALLAREWAGEDPFLLTYGDIIMESSDYQAMAGIVETDLECKGVLAVRWVDDPTAGAAVYEQDGRINRVIEKPAPATSTTHWNSAGGYVFRPSVFPELERVPLSPRGEYELTSAIDQMLTAGLKLRIHALKGDWRDVGRPEDLAIAEQMLD